MCALCSCSVLVSTLFLGTNKQKKLGLGLYKSKPNTVNREIFVFKNLRAINFRVKKPSSASGSDEDFLTTKFF